MLQTPLRQTLFAGADNEISTCQHMTTKFALPISMHTTQTRKRLLTLLQDGLLYPLTLISAPAGFGKTTLLLQWAQILANEHISLIWMSLDENDNDAQRFWNLVLAAFAQKLPALHTLAEQKKSVLDLLTLLINACAAHQEPIVLVLDDYHALTESSIQGQMAYFIERLPGHVHIVLSTRVEPRLPLTRFRARNQMREVHMDALRFSYEEASLFFHEEPGLALTPAEIRYLVERVHGWITALRFIAYALREQGAAKDVYAAARGSQRHLQDYIVDEILLLQEDAIQTFLLHTSLLPRFSASLCDAVLGQHNSWQLVQDIERANLFLIVEDDEAGWYSYQTLFAEALRFRLKRSETRETLALLHERAHCWYEEHGFLAEALEQQREGQKLVASSPAQEEKAQKTAYASPTLSAQPLLDSLSMREIEVLQLIAQGAPNGEIASDLVIAPNTVKRHVSNILSKLGATNRTQAVAQARAFGIL